MEWSEFFIVVMQILIVMGIVFVGGAVIIVTLGLMLRRKLWSEFMKLLK